MLERRMGSKGGWGHKEDGVIRRMGSHKEDGVRRMARMGSGEDGVKARMGSGLSFCLPLNLLPPKGKT
jgi:hypothetical protein